MDAVNRNEKKRMINHVMDALAATACLKRNYKKHYTVMYKSMQE